MTQLVKATSDKVALAHELANAQLLPKAYQKNPANLLYAIEYAEALGISPISAITSIHVIDGKPTASAQLIAGLGRRAGHKVRVTYDTATQTATAIVIRKDDPEFEFESVWTMKRAQAAGLTNKDVWRKYPDAMLKARAITEVARDAFPEALFGVIYTAEEMGATAVDEDGALVEATIVQPVVARETDPLVSAENIERFKGACALDALKWEQVALAAGVTMTSLRESDMPALRDAYKQAKADKQAKPIEDAVIVTEEESFVDPKYAAEVREQVLTVAETTAQIINLFDAHDVTEEVKANHPSNGVKAIKEPNAAATGPQIGKLRALCNAAGITTKEDQMSLMSDSTKRPITSFNDLTKGEASELISVLAPVKA